MDIPTKFQLSAEVVAARVAACASCPSKTANGRCKSMACGSCSLDRQQRHALGRCPRNLWGALPPLPERPTKADSPELAARFAACKACEHYTEITRSRPAFVLTFGLCARLKEPIHRTLSNKAGTCPLGKWPKAQ